MPETEFVGWEWVKLIAPGAGAAGITTGVCEAARETVAELIRTAPGYLSEKPGDMDACRAILATVRLSTSATSVGTFAAATVFVAEPDITKPLSGRLRVDTSEKVPL